MPQLRQDPSTNEWVIISKERAKRPDEFRKAEKKKIVSVRDPKCPFCPGNEFMTPPEVLAYRAGKLADASDWRVRAIPNKYAALMPDGDLSRAEQDDFFRWMNGVGQHEVVIETPVHNRFIYLMEEKEVEEIILSYRKRYQMLRQDPRCNVIIIFKNHGEAAGTSLEHPHSPIVAAPIKDENKDYYLWHFQLLPRLTTVAGFELGSGIYINTALPEETAAYLRKVPIK